MGTCFTATIIPVGVCLARYTTPLAPRPSSPRVSSSSMSFTSRPAAAPGEPSAPRSGGEPPSALISCITSPVLLSLKSSVLKVPDCESIKLSARLLSELEAEGNSEPPTRSSPMPSSSSLPSPRKESIGGGSMLASEEAASSDARAAQRDAFPNDSDVAVWFSNLCAGPQPRKLLPPLSARTDDSV